ncbi:DEAD/DEAH box helicase [Bifidobacterium oedipodis]|uniref:DEAD/DEAH box helicase n=1 Tax=Bifidobacterium oedipodis TaxID=2675322 RepID=A0A7Y0ESD7_9BIFI|nr:DEAD/DEAH box helicase [Bifidobacterium sp. DSM 109957]NMM94451.1 DEAD/DEAH box helicase [Bifidobacterium sp. DSM 109957]
MYDSLRLFAEPTRAWFAHALGVPTEVQAQAWPAIRFGSNVLVIAPTGSGKTLTAFLSAIDRLMQGSSSAFSGNANTQSAETSSQTVADCAPAPEHNPNDSGKQSHVRKAKPTKGVRVLYISPLKALAADVAKNLEIPLAGIAAECAACGLPAPTVSIATRSGDTTAAERRRIATHPPDILVTTPESFYLMLTSKARTVFTTVDTVIVDEVHALAGTKRGAHLALSLERLEELVPSSFQRIGLSATVNPPETVARFLGGNRLVNIINPISSPQMDLSVVEPLADMRDLQSANVKHRAGGIDASQPGTPEISGVTPAMRRLAERKGLTGRRTLAKPDGDGIGYQAIVGAAGDGQGGMGSATDGNTGSMWPIVEHSVLDAILAHHTTLVFVNSRGLAEKLTARLNDLYAERTASSSTTPFDTGSPEGRSSYAQHYDAVVGGTTQLVQAHDAADTIAMAHHGSVSKDRRKRIEEDLKHGRLRCVVATSSLELGIDMGSVDLVIQIMPPLSVSSGLQRVGRADHRVGGVSHALFYPMTREQIIGVAASIESMHAGDIEPIHVPRNPLDILAQQTVAAAAMEDLDADRWYAIVRRAAPFAQLDRATFDAVMGMMTGAYNTEDFSAFRPPLMMNEDNGQIAARPGAQRLAVTSGGTIPDRGLYTVVLPETDAGKGPRRVGELDEEMVYESRVGDVITLGTSTWQIQEITRDRVIVTPAPGRTARLPFWHGDGAGRDAGFGRAKGRFLREISAGLLSRSSEQSVVEAESKDLAARFSPAIMQRLAADGLDHNAISNLATLLGEQRASTGVIPNDRHLILECCPDEEGDWRIILHSPYGRRVHEPWAMSVNTRIKQHYGFDGQTYAADDGIIIRLPDGASALGGLVQGLHNANSWLWNLFVFDPDELTRDIETQVGESVLFAARFRECAARSLFLPRANPGKRVPLWQQRLRAAQLLNAARSQRNFPLLLETARECLQDVYDMPALRAIMTDLNAGTIILDEVHTDQPSPLAENLLFGYVGQVMYQYDVPQAERSAQLLSVDPQVLERLLGSDDMAGVLDQQVIAEVENELAERTFWNELDANDVIGRTTRYAKIHGPFTADELIQALGVDATTAVRTLDELTAKGELMQGHFTQGSATQQATQRSSGLCVGYVGADSANTVTNGSNATSAEGENKSAVDSLRPMQWLHRDVFRRIRNRSLKKARAAITPADPHVYQSFLLELQGIGPVGGERYEGVDGLMRVIEQLEGVALPAQEWEETVFPSRVRNYTPSMLDELIAGGEVIWAGCDPGGSDTSIRMHDEPAQSMRKRNNRTADSTASIKQGLIAFHPAGSILIPSGKQHGVHSAKLPYAQRAARAGVGTLPDAIMDVLERGGAYRADQLASLVRQVWEESAPSIDPETGEIMAKPWSNQQFEEALWSQVWRGEVTNSSFVPVRALQANARTVRTPARASRRHIRIQSTLPATMGGLWMAVSGESGDNNDRDEQQPAIPEAIALERVETLLDRYGVIVQPLIDKERLPGGFSGLYPVLKRMEEHGRLVRGMFVQGFGAAQFAETGTVNALRAQANRLADRQAKRSEQSPVAISAIDPANLSGAAVAWPQVPSGTVKPSRRAGSIVVIGGGRLILFAAVKSRHLTVFSSAVPEQSQETAAQEAMNRNVTLLRSACTELAYALRRAGSRSITFADANGEALAASHPLSRVLHQAGFTPVPQGMRLY